ncbi:MAG TPA: hypothetical protein VHU22_08435 [Xanthobacteraceae bacterium]|jgi:hypothetical protein|nr:hypothetical protein [Xanthobacteraceae bacterium]
MPLFVRLAATWPPIATWQGFTAAIAEALYVAWLIAATLLPVFVWLVLGGVLLLLLAVRYVLLQTVLSDEAADSGGLSNFDWRTRYNPIVYFLHRNYTLHLMACLAITEADRFGAFLMLTAAAFADYNREINIRRRSGEFADVTDANSKFIGFGTANPLTQSLITAAVCFSVLTWLWSIHAAGNPLLELLGELATPLAHFQHSIVDYSRLLERGGAFGDAIRYRITDATCVAILLFFCLARQTSIMEFTLWGAMNRSLRVSPFARAMLCFPLILVLHVMLNSGGPYPDDNVGIGSVISIFTRYDALRLFIANIIIIFFMMVQLVDLTELRVVDNPSTALEVWDESWPPSRGER